MGAYYYLLSSLPSLEFTAPPPFSLDGFLALSSPWLTRGDFKQLQSAHVEVDRISIEKVTNKLLFKWVVFESTVRNELVKLRSEQLGLPEASYLRSSPGFEAGAVKPVRHIMEAYSPFQGELNLIRLRWDFLTDQEVGHYFDITALMIYGLKIQLLERLGRFNTEKGREIFRGIYERNIHE